MVEFVPTFASQPDDSDAVYVVLKDDYHLAITGDAFWRPLTKPEWQSLAVTPVESHHVGFYGNRPAFAVRVAEAALQNTFLRWEQIRFLLRDGIIDTTGFELASCSLQVFHWAKTHQYCGECGTATEVHETERARVCAICRHHYYPRISPCVIGLITKDDHCLLAAHARSKGAFFSPLAGFIEPGESIEGALHREVAEEVNLQIGNLRYFGSQPWPFPGQLMVGFHADYAGGDIKVDGEEIVEARWFHYRDLPSVPAGGSLSGQLITHFIEQCEVAEN